MCCYHNTLRCCLTDGHCLFRIHDDEATFSPYSSARVGHNDGWKYLFDGFFDCLTPDGIAYPVEARLLFLLQEKTAHLTHLRQNHRHFHVDQMYE